MPFKTVSQPRRVAQLQGETIGASYNKKMGYVAFMARKPVQVAVIAQAGSPSKVFGAQLDDVSDIALLSRDMCVVKSSDKVWALVDIQHTAKLEQISSEVRMLVGPQGEAALALKWDDTCDQLTPGKNEVSVRSISLRGDHRAIAVGETECYVVVEGGNGEGEFRLHPGSSPEQGSIGKIALPEGSKGLDRISGGKFLTAIYKRGEAGICLVRRMGNRLETKFIRLNVPVTDVAVAETSLLAVAKDGRVMLYDSDAIQASENTLIEAKSETHLGCTGEPRAMVVAHGAIFVGTSSGEIVTAVLVRKTVMQ